MQHHAGEILIFLQINDWFKFACYCYLVTNSIERGHFDDDEKYKTWWNDMSSDYVMWNSWFVSLCKTMVRSIKHAWNDMSSDYVMWNNSWFVSFYGSLIVNQVTYSPFKIIGRKRSYSNNNTTIIYTIVDYLHIRVISSACYSTLQ